MKSAKDVLSKEVYDEYQESWLAFPQRYMVATPKEVHNGRPVISKTFRFQESNIFRAHVFNQRLRKFDPYFLANKHPLPFWHAIHYFFVSEQLYTAASKLLIGQNYERQVAKDVPSQVNWKRPVFWDDNISLELIREDKGTRASFQHTRTYLNIYSDKTGKLLSQNSADAYAKPRTYVQDITRIKKGDLGAIDDLVRKIEMQQVNHRRLLQVRKTLRSSADDLIGCLREGELPIEDVHDYFSLWE